MTHNRFTPTFKIRTLPWALAFAIPALSASLAAQTLSPTPAPVPALESTLPEVQVSAQRPFVPQSSQSVDLSTGRVHSVRDSAALLGSVPGAAVVRNGSQTGIVQLRGLFGDRVNVLVDGMDITPACPNHMDPPLHYITAAGLASLEVIAGISPVSMGGDSIAGSVIAKSAAPRFGSTDQMEAFGSLSASASSANHGTQGRLNVGTANQQVSLGYTGETQSGDDLKFPGGTVRASGYELTKHDLTLGTKVAGGTLRLDLGRHESRDAGTPALPMDMVKDNADKIALSYLGELSFGTLEARIYQHDIDHLMDNYSLRGQTTGMQAPATSKDTGYQLNLSVPSGSHTYRVGMEYLTNDFDVYSQSSSLAAATIKDNIRHASRDRLGVFGEWEAKLSPQWKTLLGLRSDTVKSDAAAVTRLGMAPSAMVQADAARFNAASRNRTDHNWDLAAQAVYSASATSDYEFGIARKTRSPNLMERYVWSPNNATAGLADGRTYLGNLDLKPEVSHQFSVAADWRGTDWQVKPGVFYNRVNDYIQGTSTGRKDGADKVVLQYNNIDAELYGLDLSWQYQAATALTLSGNLAYVRGKNRTTADNLYRIAPLQAIVNADYKTGPWTHRAEWHLAAAQTDVSSFNGETATAGYGLLHARTQYAVQKNLNVHFGIENLLDKTYAEHLSGINRVSGSDVALGARLPGAGRFAYVALDYTF
jgi:iron complex outermembrane receptor protein